VITTLDDSIILDCYRLAKYYCVDPRSFLDMPMSEVGLHMARTAQVVRERRAREPEEE
jgi:hypothetical protein